MNHILNCNSSVQSTLSTFLESGNLSDVEFIVGPQKVGIKAHQIILQMRSNVFSSMLSPHWIGKHNSEHQNETPSLQVEIPHLDPAVFKSFLKYLYTDEIVISEDNDIRAEDELIDLLAVADMYGVVILYEKIVKILMSCLSVNNCVNIYESTKVLNEELSGKAKDFIKENISQLLHHNAYLDSGKDGHWSLETWVDILQSDGMVVEEVDLFVAIVKWADGDEVRSQNLSKSLVSLIRYPIMTSEEFAEFVVPAGYLRNIDVIKMLLFYIDSKGNHTQNCLPYTFLSRTVKVPTSSAELTYFLKRATPGDVIQLLDRSYHGSFTLSANYITIKGQGPNSALITDDVDNIILSLEGNRCIISNIRFHHDSESKPRSVKPLIHISGYRNTLNSLEVNTGRYWTEIALPDGCVTSYKLLKQNPCFAISLVGGEGHTISNLICVNRGNGISIEGNGKEHTVVGLTSTQSTDGLSRCDFGTAVSLLEGGSHALQNICGDWYLRFGEKSQNATVNECDLLGVCVDGSGHDFMGLKARKWIKIKGQGHTFDDLCEAGRWDGR